MKTTLLFFLLFASITAKAQQVKIDDIDILSDSLILLNYIDIPYHQDTDPRIFRNREDIRSYADSMKIDLPDSFNDYDPEKNIISMISYHGIDCHSTFRFEMLRYNQIKEFKIFVKVKYGGCRAGGNYYTQWVLMPKVPEDFKIKLVRLKEE
ncbi:hypothetical protein BH10BAC5_BH10BAC5_20700 [soil metagenome]